MLTTRVSLSLWRVSEIWGVQTPPKRICETRHIGSACIPAPTSWRRMPAQRFEHQLPASAAQESFSSLPLVLGKFGMQPHADPQSGLIVRKVRRHPTDNEAIFFFIPRIIDSELLRILP